MTVYKDVSMTANDKLVLKLYNQLSLHSQPLAVSTILVFCIINKMTHREKANFHRIYCHMEQINLWKKWLKRKVNVYLFSPRILISYPLVGRRSPIFN